MIKTVFFAAILFLISITNSFSQDNTNTSAKYLSWAAIQVMPSPVFFHDGNAENNRVIFGLRWHVTPLNISFRSNKYTSPFQFFMINPVRKFTGSIEFFLQPEWAAGNFKYSRLGRFGLNAGSRITLPISGDGENISVSIGGKYNYRDNFDSDKDGFFGVETGIYFYYGMLGVQANYNFNTNSKYNIGIYFKYF